MQTIFATGFYLALAMGNPLLAIAAQPSIAQPSPAAQISPTAQVAPVETVKSSDHADAVITLERTACFGTCPVYQLTVYGDGRVVYEGRAFVTVTGQRTAQISPEQVEQLVTAFETANFFSLENQYIAKATDLPGAWTSISSNGQSKRVWRYGSSDSPELNNPELNNPDLNNAPRSLTELENQIDKIVNSQQWVGN